MCTAPEGYLTLCIAPEGGATLGVENNVVHLVQCSDNIPLKHGHCRLVLTCDIGECGRFFCFRVYSPSRCCCWRWACPRRAPVRKVFRCRTDMRQGIGEDRRGLPSLRPNLPSASASSEIGSSKHGSRKISRTRRCRKLIQASPCKPTARSWGHAGRTPVFTFVDVGVVMGGGRG